MEIKSRKTRGQRTTLCSCGCGKELEKDRQGKQRYRRECHAKNMRRYRTNKKAAMQSLQEENERLKNELKSTREQKEIS